MRSVRSGWVGGGVTDEKGGSRNRGGQDPLTPPPSGHAYARYLEYRPNSGAFMTFTDLTDPQFQVDNIVGLLY